MSGQRQQGGRVLAGFWRRAVAALIDTLLLGVVLVAAEAGYLASTGSWTVDLDDPAQPIVAASVLVAAVLYDVLLTWRMGGTLGKRAMGVSVVRRDGDGVGLGVAIARLLARVVSVVPALLGFFWAAWDSRKQTWHDKLADTVVVRDDVPVARPVVQSPNLEDDAHMRAPVSSLDDEAHMRAPVSSLEDEAQGAPVQPEHDTGPIHQESAPPAEQPQPVAGFTSGAPQPWAPQAPQPQPQEQQPQPPEPQPQPFQAQPQPFQAQPPAPQPQPAPPTWAAPQQPAWSPQQPATAWAPQAPQSAPVAAPPGGLTPPPPMPTRNDPNAVAIGRAGLGHDAAMWLQQVADQVDARLDRVSTTWRTSPHAEAARACAFGLLLGHLARLYPHMRPELNATAELHPSFSTLLEGSRLATLEQIVAEPGRIAAWLGPLIDVQDPERLRMLLD